jgi:hypothetical protein
MSAESGAGHDVAVGMRRPRVGVVAVVVVMVKVPPHPIGDGQPATWAVDHIAFDEPGPPPFAALLPRP